MCYTENMKSFDISKNAFLKRMDSRVHRRLGDNIYLIMLIMGALFVFSGLLVGIMGRGWLAAWFLVLLGVICGFFPCLHHFITYYENRPEPDQGMEVDDPGPGPGSGSQPDPGPGPDFGPGTDRGPRMGFGGAGVDPDRVSDSADAGDMDEEEAARWAVEIEAMMARERLKKEEELRRREEEMRRREEEILREARRKERERILEEERRKAEKERERRRRNEESRARWDRKTKNVYRTENFTSKGVGYFDGIRSSQELKKRYKALVKQHHPDNGGTPEMMHEIQKQYHELENFFKSYEKHQKRS